MNRAEELFQRLVDKGERAIDELIADRTSEELFLDFKASSENGAGTKLAHSDREKVAKAISGFGNSEGGVIVWGVDCDRLLHDGDVARAKRPVQNPKRFKSWLEAAVSGCRRTKVSSTTSSRPHLVKTRVFSSPSFPRVCALPTSASWTHKHRYYIRAGSNFDHVPHGVLAGMFGKQPQPCIFQMWKNYGGGMSGSNRGIISANPAPEDTPYFSVGFVLRNEGMSVARDLYVNIELGLPGPDCASRILLHGNPHQYQPWICYSSFDHVHHFVSVDAFKLAPGAMVEPAEIELSVKPPFETGLFYRITFGCTGTPVNTITESVPREEVQQAYDAFIKSDRSKGATRKMASALLHFGAGNVDEEDDSR